MSFIRIFSMTLLTAIIFWILAFGGRSVEYFLWMAVIVISANIWLAAGWIVSSIKSK